MKKLLIFLIFTFSIASISQTEPLQQKISHIRKAFEQLDYQTAKTEAEKALQFWEQYSIVDLIEIHKILGIIAYSEGSFLESKAQFEKVLFLNSATQLDSVFVSPKIISFFDKVKANFESDKEPVSLDQYRYILIPDPRPAAFLRSFVLPGWGQFYKGEKKKGTAFLVATGMCLVSWTTLYFLQQHAHKKYQNAVEPADIERKYDSYNKLYKSRQIAQYVIGGIWLVSLTDVLLTKPSLAGNLAIIPQKTSDSYSLSVTIKF